MMSLLLCSVSASALLSGQGEYPLFEDGLVTLNPTEVHPGFIFSADQTEIFNDDVGNDTREWARAIHPITPDMGDTYWEIHLNTISTASFFNGYLGVLSQDQVDSPSYGWGENQNPIQVGSLSYRGNGSIWGNNGTSQTNSPDSYGPGDVLMFSFNAETGVFQVGKNGVWATTTKTSNRAGGTFWPFVQARGNKEGGRLVSLPSEFVYPIPENHGIIHRAILAAIMDVGVSQAVLGSSQDQASLHKQTSHIVFGGRAEAASVRTVYTYAVIEE